MSFQCSICFEKVFHHLRLSFNDQINPYLMNGISHHYQLDGSTFSFTGVRSDFKILFLFFDEIPMSKQNSPRCDTAFSSGAILFAYVP